MALDLEEWGREGSAALAQHLRNAKQPLQLMVSLEMRAFTSERRRCPVPGMERVCGRRGDFMALVANAGRGIPDVRLSDHSPIWNGATTP